MDGKSIRDIRRKLAKIRGALDEASDDLTGVMSSLEEIVDPFPPPRPAWVKDAIVCRSLAGRYAASIYLDTLCGTVFPIVGETFAARFRPNDADEVNAVWRVVRWRRDGAKRDRNAVRVWLDRWEPDEDGEEQPDPRPHEDDGPP